MEYGCPVGHFGVETDVVTDRLPSWEMFCRDSPHSPGSND